MNGMMRFPKTPAVTPLLGGSPPIPSSIPEYPWVDGELLYAEALNAAIAYSASVYDIASFGAKSDGATDDSAAVSAAIAAASAAGGGKIILSAGRTVLGSSIVATIPAGVALTIEGMGSGASELYFSNATDGLNFKLLNSGSAWGSVSLHGFTLTRGPTSPVMANTGIYIYADPTVAKICGPLMSFRDLTIRGSSPLANQWLNSFSISGISGCTFDCVNIIGCNATTVDQGDALLTVDGPASTQYATGIYIANSTLQGGSAGINVTRYVQGVFVANCVVIGNYDSIRWAGSPTYHPEELAVVNCSLNAGHRGVYISAVNQSSISNTTILRLIAGVTAGYAGIEINAVFLCNVTGNNIIGLNNANTENGIIVSNCGTGVNTVIGNTVANMTTGYAVWLSGNTSNTITIGNGGNNNGVSADTGGNVFLGNTVLGHQRALSTNQPMVFLNSTVAPTTATRWFVGNDGSTESGSNTGNNFEILRADDTGTVSGTPFSINRATGMTTLGALAITGTFGVFGTTPPTGGKPTVTGAKGGNAALASLLAALASYGLFTDSSTA